MAPQGSVIHHRCPTYDYALGVNVLWRNVFNLYSPTSGHEIEEINRQLNYAPELTEVTLHKISLINTTVNYP